jgi:hypothetical protein
MISKGKRFLVKLPAVGQLVKSQLRFTLKNRVQSCMVSLLTPNSWEQNLLRTPSN